MFGVTEVIVIRGVFRTLLNINYQKQPSRSVIIKRCSENMQQIYRRTRMSKCDLLCNFYEITLRRGCSLINLLHIFQSTVS